MDFSIGADINDAFASRMPLAGPQGGPTVEFNPEPQPVASPPVVLTPMASVPSPHQHDAPPGVPHVTQEPLPLSQPSAPTHVPYVPEPAAFALPLSHGNPPPALSSAEPGYLETLSARRKDVLRLAILALMVTLGIGIHGLLSHYTKVWIESGQFTSRQEFFARLIYPAGVLFALWNLKAIQ